MIPFERIGVYLCHCGTNIADTVDITEVAEFARRLDNVAIVRDHTYLCSSAGQNLIQEDINTLGLTRVVIAACSPLMHESTFRQACQAAGLNPFNIQIANIRERIAWVTLDGQQATQKSKGVIAAAVRRVAFHQPLEVRQAPVTPAVLVVGGGVVGIEAALRLAEAGTRVILVEREPSIGGHMAMLDKTFPTLDCAACVLVPNMVKIAEHPNITLLSYSQVEDVAGFVGNFRVRVRKKARYVDETRCTGCGLCVEKCPWKNIPSEFDQGMATRSAIYFPFPQAVPGLPLIDSARCAYFLRGTCRVCERLCPINAIDFEQQDTVQEFNVGAIILATGFQLFDPRRAIQYGYGRWDNILTSLQFERLCHPSGPTGGKIVMKDGREPERIAILHCIGSRDEKFNRYCSRVCCMASLKFALSVKERTHARVLDFYIDMRAFGKGYEEFYERAQRAGVIFVHGKGAEVIYRGGALLVKAEDTLLGRRVIVPVDMVILAVGMEPRQDAAEVARLFGIGRSQEGFFMEKHPKLAPVETSVDGIFIAGGCQGPKDIPDSVAQGAAAAASALALINKGMIDIQPIGAVVNPTLCSDCWLCLSECPYHAIGRVPFQECMVAWVNEVLCQGCGVCVADCPAGAIVQPGYTDAQIFAEIEGLLMHETCPEGARLT
jgi:heterodisulfide reductase subunit A